MANEKTNRPFEQGKQQHETGKETGKAATSVGSHMNKQAAQQQHQAQKGEKGKMDNTTVNHTPRPNTNTKWQKKNEEKKNEEEE